MAYRTRSNTLKLQRLIEFLKDRGSDCGEMLEQTASVFLDDVKPKSKVPDHLFYQLIDEDGSDKEDSDDSWGSDWEEWSEDPLPELEQPKTPPPTPLASTAPMDFPVPSSSRKEPSPPPDMIKQVEALVASEPKPEKTSLALILEPEASLTLDQKPDLPSASEQNPETPSTSEEKPKEAPPLSSAQKPEAEPLKPVLVPVPVLSSVESGSGTSSVLMKMKTHQVNIPSAFGQLGASPGTGSRRGSIRPDCESPNPVEPLAKPDLPKRPHGASSRTEETATVKPEIPVMKPNELKVTLSASSLDKQELCSTPIQTGIKMKQEVDEGAVKPAEPLAKIPQPQPGSASAVPGAEAVATKKAPTPVVASAKEAVAERGTSQEKARSSSRPSNPSSPIKHVTFDLERRYIRQMSAKVQPTEILSKPMYHVPEGTELPQVAGPRSKKPTLASQWRKQKEKQKRQERQLLDRLETFDTWPYEDTDGEQLAALLADAGFCYVGPTDGVQCCSCDLFLNGWARGDDPWTRHALESPKCCYLAQTKGSQWLQDVLQSDK